MVNILIVEDEPDMQFVLEDSLQAEGYGTTSVGTGREGMQHALSGGYQLVILDLMLPDLGGIEVCKAIRGQDGEIPIIILTAKGEEIDKVVGLEVGADDYVTKPFGMREFLARIKVALRRSGAPRPTDLDACLVGNVRVEFSRRVLMRGDSQVRLTRYENDLLQYLAARRGEVVSREELLRDVWAADPSSGTRTVDNYIARLRGKIEDKPAQPRHILTVHGVGYRLA